MYVKKAERLQIELLDEYLQELGYPDHWKKFIEEEKRKEYLIILKINVIVYTVMKSFNQMQKLTNI